MRRPGLFARRFLTAMSIVVILLALVIWTVRPSPFSDWLNASGLGNNDPPLATLRDWFNGRYAPMTPTGFVTLFPIPDLFLLGALLTALCVLLVLLPTQWRNQRAGSWSSRARSLFRLPRIGVRVRTAMILIAVIGIDLGWELVAWKNWRLWERYRGQAVAYARQEGQSLEALHRAEIQLASLDTETSVPAKDTETPAARAADKAFSRDRLQQVSAYASIQAAYFAELRRKYKRAAADPSRPVPPDPPPPSGPQPLRQGIFVSQGGYAQALADCDDLLRRYPDLSWVHRERAWILASCPDARIRDGKRAVAAATHTAELTNWKDWNVLQALAAAYAEAGDFANAVRWEERALELEQEYLKRLPPNPRGIGTTHVDRDRLDLYKAGKPSRMR
jgi:tetratricopeptide (TPR) repeat protein